MATLPERELAGLLEIIGEVHHTEDRQSFRAALADVVPRVIPSPIFSYNEVAWDGRPGVSVVRPEQPPEVFEKWARLAPQNPLLRHYLATRDGRAYRFSDVISREDLHALEIYRELYRPMGVEHQLAVCIPAPPGLLMGIVISDESDFTDSQRLMLDLARPHIIQAFANAAQLERLHDVLDALSAGLEDTAEAVVVVGEDERVQFASSGGRSAVALLTGHEPVAGDMLPAQLRARASCASAARASPSRAARPSPCAACRPSAARRPCSCSSAARAGRRASCSRRSA